MKHIGNQRALAKKRRLRIVFGQTMVTRDISVNATYEDIARTLSKLSKRRYGRPLAISATFEPALPVGLLH